MAVFELVMPKLGESIYEATILNWVKKEGDSVQSEDTVLEIATDKVDSEVPSPVSGKIVKLLFQVNDVVPIGAVIAHIETESNGESKSEPPIFSANPKSNPIEDVPYVNTQTSKEPVTKTDIGGDRFYSPLVKNIAKQEGISASELDAIPGSGMDGRLTKQDLISYMGQRGAGQVLQVKDSSSTQNNPAEKQPAIVQKSSGIQKEKGSSDEIIEMDRMRRLIADHMVMSKQTSPHVTSFVEADVTNLVKWREGAKNGFIKKYNQKITFTPLFIDAVVRAIRDFPLINVTVDGQSIIVKKNINIGMAAALPTGNLIVPVIKDADTMNLIGLTKVVNDLAERARNNSLKPEEIQGGTFTITNVGTFGNDMGTPIINQPQVAILAVGAIKKKPVVLETEYGDIIAIRHMMILSLSYDHRVVDGFLGGSFLKRIADNLENFDPNTTY